ncbi:hypothetical protein CVT26_009800 [Gymnopilus dilepis]|uniref:Vta1/callose synthase N-terminal domain-containing protein n=1 Tax=Gymnopilus dilepis TaxID=231916 RepID=A0A409YI49_9AGAR|nr:hypothetical protein CVT26_009800 [Gymnopilus dilepis]
MSSSILGLPPIPPELKPIIPYLQRAEELKSQDPIISYWCAYYAAQLGISLKARNAEARDLLFALLSALEQMKADIGAHDAIDIEAVSSAYVENFALKVFANADNEDRSGRATRSTAKKFLAAANFLEVLKTFPKTDFSEANEEKVRYAKWKAADIAKAFREGRKPIPGPPGWAEEQEELKRLQEAESSAHTPSPPRSQPRSSHSPSTSPSKRSPMSSSPPRMSGFDRGFSDGQSENWSTAATPGTDTDTTHTHAVGTSMPNTAGYDWNEPRRTKPRSGSGSSSNTIGSNGGKSIARKGAWTDEELSGAKNIMSSSPTKSSFKSGSPDSDKKVHFSPSTAGSPPPPPPPPLPISGSPPKEYIGPASIYAPPQFPVVPPPTTIPSTSGPTYSTGISPPVVPIAPSISPPRNTYTPNVPTRVSPIRPTAVNYPGAPPVQPPPVDLTPGLIGKIQKHCRFAISALDYEDAEQARKELRTALSLLGG